MKILISLKDLKINKENILLKQNFQYSKISQKNKKEWVLDKQQKEIQNLIKLNWNVTKEYKQIFSHMKFKKLMIFY